jgi:hypothetical protein
MLRRLRSRRGQIVIPAMFVFPSLMLFVYLIFETAKLSREKIRHQFAIDAAAFVEMTNYSDFLNRTAYVNGAFPQRIFVEGFDDGYTVSCSKKVTNCGSGVKDNALMRNILYDNGAFPCISEPCPAHPPKLDNVAKWEIKRSERSTNDNGEQIPNFSSQNSDPPNVAEDFILLSEQNAIDYWINWEEANSIYKLYVQIYQLLGSVEEAQYQVLQRLSSGHNFLAKSYWLNTGDAVGSGNEAVSSFGRYSNSFKAKAFCHKTLSFYGNKPVDDTYQGWKQVMQDKIPLKYMQSCDGGAGLFQVMWVDKGQIDAMRAGYDVVQHWRAPSNFFNVDFNTGIRALNNGEPFVRARVTCGESGSQTKPNVWPNPTPKFQVRLYP